jgi:hypothetical protein
MYRLLWGGLVSLGLQPFVEEEADRLATVNTIKVLRTAANACRSGAYECRSLHTVVGWTRCTCIPSAANWRVQSTDILSLMQQDSTLHPGCLVNCMG